MEEVDGRVAGNQVPRHFFTIFAKDGRSVSHDPPARWPSLSFAICPRLVRGLHFDYKMYITTAEARNGPRYAPKMSVWVC